MNPLLRALRTAWEKLTGQMPLEPGSKAAEQKSGLDQLSDHLGYTFSDPQLLGRALTHKSYVNTLPKARRRLQHYENLEFLGDAVVYRRLVPSDPRLPALSTLRERLELKTGSIPRKAEPAYGRVVAEILRQAQVLEWPSQPIRSFVFSKMVLTVVL